MKLVPIAATIAAKIITAKMDVSRQVQDDVQHFAVVLVFSRLYQLPQSVIHLIPEFTAERKVLEI